MKWNGKLGFFDSGIGWLTVMQAFQEEFPRIDMVYFGDRANCPYGDRSREEILRLVEQGVERLVREGAIIIILACNTAVAQAVRYLQQEKYPDGSGIKILWVTLPGAEKVVELGYERVGVLATAATVKSRAYRERVWVLDHRLEVQEIAVPWLVNLIEAEIHDTAAIDALIREAIVQFHEDTQTLVLGCTHYPIVRPAIERAWADIHKSPICIVDPGKESALKFHEYLNRHPEYVLSETGAPPIIFFE